MAFSVASQPSSSSTPVMLACTSPPTPSHSEGQATEQALTLRGGLHVVWNHEPRYFLIDAGGRPTELLLDSRRVEELGGPRALDGRAVRVTGTVADPATGAVRVQAIELETPNPG